MNCQLSSFIRMDSAITSRIMQCNNGSNNDLLSSFENSRIVQHKAQLVLDVIGAGVWTRTLKDPGKFQKSNES